jgi:hypothetical protein
VAESPIQFPYLWENRCNSPIILDLAVTGSAGGRRGEDQRNVCHVGTYVHSQPLVARRARRTGAEMELDSDVLEGACARGESLLECSWVVLSCGCWELRGEEGHTAVVRDGEQGGQCGWYLDLELCYESQPRGKCKHVGGVTARTICCNSAHSTRPTRTFTQRTHLRRARSRRIDKSPFSSADLSFIPISVSCSETISRASATKFRTATRPTPIKFHFRPPGINVIRSKFHPICMLRFMSL